MTHTSSPTILGKWKLAETRDDLDNPKPVNNGRRGEIIEFTADGRMRWPGTTASRSKSFGPVRYRLNPKKQPAHFDTLYASGMALRTGIYRLDGDRLIICSTAEDFGKGRPRKFGGFTSAEADRLRSVEKPARFARLSVTPRPPPPKVSLTRPVLRFLRFLLLSPEWSRLQPFQPGWFTSCGPRLINTGALARCEEALTTC